MVVTAGRKPWPARRDQAGQGDGKVKFVPLGHTCQVTRRLWRAQAPCRPKRSFRPLPVSSPQGQRNPCSEQEGHMEGCCSQGWSEPVLLLGRLPGGAVSSNLRDWVGCELGTGRVQGWPCPRRREICLSRNQVWCGQSLSHSFRGCSASGSSTGGQRDTSSLPPKGPLRPAAPAPRPSPSLT